MQRKLQLLVFGCVRLRIKKAAYPARLLSHQLHGSSSCHICIYPNIENFFFGSLTPTMLIARRVKCLPSPLPRPRSLPSE